MRLSPLFRLIACCGLALLAAGPAAAQGGTYSSKPITLVVGYPPGGSTDLTARTLGAELSTRLGVPVLIENVGAGGGAIGAQKVANATPDGYTLLVGANNEVAINRLVAPGVKYEPKDFTPVGLIASQPLVLVASPRPASKPSTSSSSWSRTTPASSAMAARVSAPRCTWPARWSSSRPACS